MHICVGNLTIIGWDNGLSPARRQAIIWTNAGILLIGPLGTNFSEILIGIQTFSFTKMHLKMSSAKWRPFCLGLNVLKMIAVVICFTVITTTAVTTTNHNFSNNLTSWCCVSSKLNSKSSFQQCFCLSKQIINNDSKSFWINQDFKCLQACCPECIDICFHLKLISRVCGGSSNDKK